MIWFAFSSLAFYVDSWWGRTATTSIFIAAAITDWLDGYIARKVCLPLQPVDEIQWKPFFFLLFCKSLVTLFNFSDWNLDVFQMRLHSVFGAFLDPVADKVCSFFLWFFVWSYKLFIWYSLIAEVSMLTCLNHWAFHLIPCLLNVAYGCCYFGLIMFKTFECCCVWASAMATDCTINSHYWKGGNVYYGWRSSIHVWISYNILQIVGNLFVDNHVSC